MAANDGAIPSPRSSRSLPSRARLVLVVACGRVRDGQRRRLGVLDHQIGQCSPRRFQTSDQSFRLPRLDGVSVLLAISAVAGVVEEAAFRGYLISQIQRRHGWIIAILISGVMFFVSHLNHAYVTLAFLPFFLVVSSIHGLLVYLTRSILPSVVLHSVADLITIPIQYGLIGHVSVVPVWEAALIRRS